MEYVSERPARSSDDEQRERVPTYEKIVLSSTAPDEKM